MVNEQKTTVYCSVLLPTLLTVLFAYLKLTNQIDWSWWLVSSPVWITFLIVILSIGSLYNSVYMDSQANKDRGSLGCLLPILLVVLLSTAKYSGVFPYSWIWVLSPIWLPIMLLVSAVLILGTLLMIILIIKAFHE